MDFARDMMAAQRTLAWIALLIGALAVPGCGFDSAALSSRACSSDTECENGSCLNGYCQGGGQDLIDVGIDVDVAPDVFPPDAADDATGLDGSPDTGDDADAEDCPSSLFCRGDELVSCDGGVVSVEADCGSADACTSESGCYCAGESCEARLCVPGELRCVVDSLQGVEVCAADGLSYVMSDDCGDDSYCADGECVASACTPDTQACTSEIITDCGPEGTVVSVEDCARTGGFCVEVSAGEFECQDQVCEPGARRCGNEDETIDDVFVCDSRGSAEVQTPCTGQICVAGACVDSACEPASSVCIDDFTVGVCTDDGRGYDRAGCADGQYCDPVASACVDQLCEPGVSRCGSGNTREVCDERGASYGIPERCVGATTCIAGVCTDQVCPAGLRYCDDEGRAASCSLGGSTVTTQECDFRCEDGFCEESICGDGIVDDESDEECDDGDELACNRCDSCSARNVLVVRDGSRTTATGSWIPNESAFTIEFWLRPEEETGAIFGIGSTNGRDGVLVELNSRYVVFTFRTDEDTTVGVRSSVRLPVDTWSHVAVTRSGRTAGTIHVNGNLVGASNRDLSRVSIDATDGILWIASDSRVNALASRLDELRVSSSVRYTSNFAPAPRFEPDGNTVALWHFDEGVGQTVASETGGISATVTEVGWNASSCFGAGSATAECGDGGLAPWEDCDDGNAVAGDGCSPTCRIESRCQIGFERAGATEGGCYLVLNQTQDWETARDTCRALGVSADLATINDAAENTALRASTNGNFWIGYNDRDDFIGNGPFVWSAGSSSYSNWASGEPNDAGPATFTREDCTEVRGDGAWNDSRCSDGKFAVCEFPF